MEAAAASMGVAEGFLLIIDVSLDASDPEAADASLAELLHRYDIAYGSEVEVGEQVVQSLEKSRLVNQSLDDRRLQDSQGRVDLIFVKARANRLDSAMIEMMGDTESFPEFAMDFAMDPPALELFDQLRGVQEAELRDDRAATVSIASPLHPSGGITGWAANQRRSSMPLAARQNSRAFAGTLVAGDVGNPVSYALLVVRHGADAPASQPEAVGQPVP